MKVSRYNPQILDPSDLEALFVQRHQLAKRLVEQIRVSALTDSKQFNLLIGPRGIGKTHLISMLYHRVTQQADLNSHLVIAWLREEEWGIGSFFDLVLRILNVLQAEYQDDDLASKISSLYDISPKEAEQVALATLKTFIGEQTLLLLMENLEDVFAGLGDIGQKQLRSFLQEQGCCTIVATSQSLFNGVKLQTSPFYGFFRIQYLKDFSVDEAVSLLTKIAEQEEDAELVDFLRTAKGRSRVQAVHHLAGGNPRIYVVFSEFLTHESLNDLIQPFMSMLDDLTPYYQARMMYLSPQQRKIIEVLSRRKYAMAVKEIAQRCFVTHQTVSSQLKDLRDKGYVLADNIGRQSLYRLREPLMRICLSLKEIRGEPIRLIVDILKAWYTRSELLLMKQQLRTKAVGQSTVSFAETYVNLALEDDEAETDPRIDAYIQELSECDQKDPERALKLVDKLMDLRDIAEDYFAQGVYLYRLERYEEAIASYKKVLEFNPNDDKTLSNLGVSQARLRQYSEAIENYNKAIEINKSNYQALSNRGIALGELSQYEEAVISFEQSLKIKPEEYDTWVNQGINLIHLDRYEEAASKFSHAICIDRNQHYAWTYLGSALDKLGQHDKAITHFDKAIEIEPKHDQSWTNRGIAFVALERFEEAIDSFGEALKINPNDNEILYNRGATLAALKRHKEAIINYDAALDIKPDDDRVWYNRGISLSYLGSYTEAFLSYGNIPQGNLAKLPYGQLNQAEVSFASHPNDEAYKALESGLSQLSEAEKSDSWHSDIMLRSLFKQNQDIQQWQFHIQKLIPLFTKYQFLNALGVGLIESCDTLISEMVSQNAAQAWLEVWTEAAEGHEEVKIPLRLLKAAVDYKAKPDDPRVFLQLPTEERTILKQALGLETE